MNIQLVSTVPSKYRCRICLDYGDGVIPISETLQVNGVSFHIFEILNKCANVEVLLGDEKPQYICHSCTNKGKDAYIFRIRCEESDAILSKEINTKLNKETAEEIHVEVGPTIVTLGVAESTTLLNAKNVDPLSNLVPSSSENVAIDSTHNQFIIKKEIKDEPIEMDVVIDEVENDHNYTPLGIKTYNKIENAFFCVPCQRNYKSRISLSRHQAAYHADETATTDIELLMKTVYCTTCMKTYPSDPQIFLTKHEQTCEYKIQTCIFCQHIFKKESEISEHFYKEHYYASEDDSEERFHCNTCELSFSQGDDLSDHIKTHRDNLEMHLESEDSMQAEEETVIFPLDIMQGKSKVRYKSSYCLFKRWLRLKKRTEITDKTMLEYFVERRKKKFKSPRSLWCQYSMLKAMIHVNDNIQITDFVQLNEFVKKQNEGYIQPQMIMFTREDVCTFLNKAPDSKYLMMKVVLIVGVLGACRREDIVNLTVDHVEDKGSSIIFTIPNLSVCQRFAIISTPEVDFVGIVRKYIHLRVKYGASKRFFITYSKGKCINLNVGINTIGKIPSQIAEYLNLKNPKSYTGHVFKRTSAVFTRRK